MKELQKLASDIVKEIDRKLGVHRDAHLTLSQLIEELGELARVVNSERLRGKIPRKEEFEEEFADVFLQLSALADIFEIDLEKAVLEKIEILKKRHGLK